MVLYNPVPFGWINNLTGTKTAYNNPTPDTTYCAEKNNVDPQKRTYYSFNTSGIEDDAIIDSATLKIRFSAVTSPALPPGGEINYKINAAVGHDFIGATVTTDDWDGASIGNNIKSWGSTSPAINTNHDITINTGHINKTGDTDIELKEWCEYVSIPSGQAVVYDLDNKSRLGLFYIELHVTYHLPSGRSFAVIIGAS